MQASDRNQNQAGVGNEAHPALDADVRALPCLMAGMLMMTAGCRTVEFYGQAVAGQVEVLAKRESIRKVIAKTGDDFLRDRLELTERLLDFARDELDMPSGGNYEQYADIGRKHLVWVLYAAPELSLEPRSWWYPVVGRQDYRGYFREHLARAESERLQAEGYETWISGVDAYSTLGWFRDPVLNTFVGRAEWDYAELIFHELAHVRHYVRGHTSWNEGLAEAVAREGVRRWLAHSGRPAEVREYELRLAKLAQARETIGATSDRLRKIYQGPGGVDSKRRAKSREMDRLRRELKALNWRWGGGLESWINGPVNNARLNSFTTYEAEVPKFTALIEECGGDFREFWRRLKELEP